MQLSDMIIMYCWRPGQESALRRILNRVEVRRVWGGNVLPTMRPLYEHLFAGPENAGPTRDEVK